MSRDDDQPEAEQVGARWNAKTAALTPRKRRVRDSDVPATEPTAQAANAPVVEAPARFEFAGELGRGGMGSVSSARDTVLERDVAIKQALSDDPEALRLFEREAKITAQLEHPSIVPVHDAGRDEQGRPYYIMRQLEGKPLADRVKGAPDVKARLALVPHVLAAVDAAAFAHARGVIHRDIKPWNILIGDYGETVLIDWGLARRLEDSEADEVFASKAAGTPGYMAPEQVRGERINARADVYALGATLLHVLIGQSALDTTPTEWMQAAANGMAPPTDKLDAEVPAELTAIVTKAMAPKAADRYADAIEMAADLRAFLAGKLVAAHHYTPVERVVRFVRRHRVAVATAVAALAAVTITAVFSIHNVVVERDLARAAKEQAADRAELMLVERASTLATGDPAHAVALLHTLPRSSHYMTRARDIAAKAAANGIAHGLRPHDGPVRALAFSPDGRQLVSTGNDGTLQIHDIATGKSRTLVRYGTPLGDAVWTNAGATIVFASDLGGLRALEVATGTVRVLDPNAHVRDLYVMPSDDRVRYLDDTEQTVVERSTQPGTNAVTLAQHVTLIAYNGDRILVAGGGAVRLIDGRGEQTLWRDEATAVAIDLAFAPDGVHAAVATFSAVIEWDLTTLAETKRWPQNSSLVVYGGQRIYATNRVRGGVLDRLATDIVQAAEGDWGIAWMTPALRGTALLDQQGNIAVADDDGLYLFRYGLHGSRVLAGRPGVPWLAVGSLNGWIRWFDLRTMLPKTYAVPKAAQLCGADDEFVYVSSQATGQLLALPRHGHKSFTIPLNVTDCLVGHAGSRIGALVTASQWAVIDSSTYKVRMLNAETVAPSGQSYFFSNKREIRELSPTEEHWVWTGPADIATFAVTPNWLAVELFDHRVIRVDRRTQRTTEFVVGTTLDHLTLASDGTIWFTIGTKLHRIDSRVSLIGSAPSEINSIGLLPDGTLVMTSRNTIWRASVGPQGNLQLTTLMDNVRSFGGTRTAASIDGFMRASLKYLDTGEEITRNSRGTIGVLVDDDVIALYVGSSEPRIEIYIDPVPPDPARLHAWIDSATNAVLEPGSDDLTWR